MRVLLVTALVTAAISCLGVGAAGAAGETKVRPTLSMVGSGPVVVTGIRFLPRERVTLRLWTGQQRLSRAVVASPAGKLVARFAGEITAPQCVGFVVSVQAIGARGSRAVARRYEIPPPCGVAPQP